MAMVNVIPTEVSVACDLFTGGHSSVRVGADDFAVIAIERMRDESAAYPVEQGRGRCSSCGP